MADLLQIPLEDDYSSSLSQPLEADAAALTFYVYTSPVFSFPSGVTTWAIINPGKTNAELVKVSAYNSSSKSMTIPSGGRAQRLYYGDTGTVQEHAIGSKVVFSDNFEFWEAIRTAIASKLDESGGTLTGDLSFSGTDHAGLKLNILTTAQRDALVSPVNGMVIYNSTAGELQYYSAGTWYTLASGSTQPNASTTVAGKVEMSTQAELDAGTATGGTGAYVVPSPDILQVTLQKGAYNYATTGGTTTAYTLTLTPAPAAYVEGMRFFAKINAANTGTSTIDVNGLGAKTIKKNTSQDVISGDMPTNSIVEFIYDGTNAVIQSISSPFALLTTKGDIIVATASNTPVRLAVGSENQVLTVNAASTGGVKWSAVNQKIATVVTPVTVTNTITETNLISVSIPANTLGTSQVVIARLYCDGFTLSSTKTATFRLKFGATTIAAALVTNSTGGTFGGGVPAGGAWIDITLIANAATNAQLGEIFIMSQPSATGLTLGRGLNGTSAEDSTAAKNLIVSVEFNNASSSDQIVMNNAYIAKIAS